MWAGGALVNSVEPERREGHRADRIVTAVHGRQIVRHEVHFDQPAGAKCEAVGDPEIADGAERDLADAMGGTVLPDLDKLPVLDDLPLAKPVQPPCFRDAPAT